MVNMNGLLNFEMDITYLYHYAKELNIEGMDAVFGQVRQTLAVILSESVSEYALSPLARSQKYVTALAASNSRFPQAQPVKVAGILDKLVAYYITQPGQSELATKRRREREIVARLIQR